MKKPSPKKRARPAGAAARRTFEADHLYSVVFSAARLSDLAPLLEIAGVDIGCRHPSISFGRGKTRMCALVAGRVLAPLLSGRQWQAEVLADQTVASRAALKLVGKGNRFRQRSALPEGAGRLVKSPDSAEAPEPPRENETSDR